MHLYWVSLDKPVRNLRIVFSANEILSRISHLLIKNKKVKTTVKQANTLNFLALFWWRLMVAENVSAVFLRSFTCNSKLEYSVLTTVVNGRGLMWSGNIKTVAVYYYSLAFFLEGGGGGGCGMLSHAKRYGIDLRCSRLLIGEDVPVICSTICWTRLWLFTFWTWPWLVTFWTWTWLFTFWTWRWLAFFELELDLWRMFSKHSFAPSIIVVHSAITARVETLFNIKHTGLEESQKRKARGSEHSTKIRRLLNFSKAAVLDQFSGNCSTSFTFHCC